MPAVEVVIHLIGGIISRRAWDVKLVKRNGNLC
jgi:hypothetical protein